MSDSEFYHAALIRRLRERDDCDDDIRGACDEIEDCYESIERLEAEIARLREAIRRLADQDATLSVQDGNVTVTMDATLTDAERDAVETAAMEADAHQHTHRAATLRGLLERLGNDAKSTQKEN